MKRPRRKPPPKSVARLGSLLHRLQKISTTEDHAQSCFDQLMIFLEDPPPGVSDRWKKGAEMCASWGISCSGTSVWRLYRSVVLEWRLHLAHEALPEDAKTLESLAQKTEQLVAHRTFEVLANPQLSPTCLVSLARIELRKKTLELACQKHLDSQRTKLQRALDSFVDEVMSNPVALAAFDQLRAALNVPEPSTEPTNL